MIENSKIIRFRTVESTYILIIENEGPNRRKEEANETTIFSIGKGNHSIALLGIDGTEKINRCDLKLEFPVPQSLHHSLPYY